MDWEKLASIVLMNLSAVTASMIFMWLLSLIRKNAGIVDVFWGTGFVLVAWLTFLNTDGYEARKIAVSVLATLWGARLSAYILLRNWGRGEDYRYKNMREKSGGSFWFKSLFYIFGLQGILMMIVSFPLQYTQMFSVPAGITKLDIAGIAIWTVGFFFETAADAQLAVFLKNPENRGRVMRSGVWKYSRHPNYFGEATMWWGIFIVSLSVPFGLICIISPLLITFLLLRVSGVTLLESSLREKRPEYAEYIRTTSSFIPWFPKKDPDCNAGKIK